MTKSHFHRRFRVWPIDMAAIVVFNAVRRLDGS
jgi:hypothetical protein